MKPRPLKWPTTVIRCAGEPRALRIGDANVFLQTWKQYDVESV